MIYTGRQVHAEEAHRIGLVNAVHPLDQLDAGGARDGGSHRQEQPGRGPRGQEPDWARLHRRSRQRGWPPRLPASAPLSPRPIGARACAPLSRSGRPTSLATKAATGSVSSRGTCTRDLVKQVCTHAERPGSSPARNDTSYAPWTTETAATPWRPRDAAIPWATPAETRFHIALPASAHTRRLAMSVSPAARFERRTTRKRP